MYIYGSCLIYIIHRGHRGRMVVGFTTTCTISAYPVHGQVYSINIM